MAKNDIPISASDVNWSTASLPIPHEPDQPPYSEVAIAIAERVNNAKPTRELKGKYIGNDYPQFQNNIYIFLVSTQNGNPHARELVCLPCPDFCVGSLPNEEVENNILQFTANGKRLNIYDLLKIWDYKQIGSLFRKNYLPENYISNYYNLYLFYIKYKDEKIRKFELNFMIALLSFNFHQYYDANNRFTYIKKHYPDFNVVKKSIPWFNESEINRRIELKSERNKLNKSLNITILHCDNGYDSYLHYWTKNLISMIDECNLNNDFDQKKDDIGESKERRFHINVINSNVFNNVDNMINSISEETDILIMVCHGNKNNFLHYYRSTEFGGEPTLVSIDSFFNHLNKLQLKNETIGMFFSCDSFPIFKLSKLKYNIACNGEYNQTLMNPYCLSFFSDIIFKPQNVGNYIEECHNRAFILASLYSRLDNVVDFKQN